MINYNIKKNKKVFDILENKTGQIIVTVLNKSAAQKIAMHLNLGGGFDSWTPAFFLKQAMYK